MAKTKTTKIEKLEEFFAGKFAGLDDEALGDVCAGILDIPDSYGSIFEEILPRIKKIESSAYGELLDELSELRSHFEHIRTHAESAVTGLDRLILVLQEKE